MRFFNKIKPKFIESASICDKGGRKHNEDYICNLESESMSCYIVCDGLGGHHGGEIASETAGEAFLKSIYEEDNITENSVKRAIDFSQECIIKKLQNNDYMNFELTPRTTIAAMVTDGDKAFLCHVGDTRIYHLKNKKINTITNDHSVAFLSYFNGEIEYSEIRRSPDQNRLLRSLGDPEKYKPEINGPIEVQSGDAFLLCSDGFWEYVEETNIEKTLKNSKTPQRWLEKMTKILNKNIKNISENDNYSAITIFIH